MFVSALGIDQTRNGITVWAETNQNNSQENKDLLFGVGNTIPEAINSLRASTPLKFDLSHCAIIAVGKRQKNTEKLLCQYILSRHEDMLSIYIVTCDNAKDLLSCNSESSVGYEISSALKNNYYAGETRTPATVIDIINRKQGYYLPYFSVSEKSYTFSGAAYYTELTRVCLKTADEVRLINMLSDNFARGRITLKGEAFEVSDCRVSSTVTNNTLKISLSLSLDSGDPRLLKESFLNILNEFKDDYALNIFRFKENGSIITNPNFKKKKIEFMLEVNEIVF